MADDLVARFRPLHEAGARAFNAGDLDTALAGVRPDFEWHPYDADPEQSVIRGPDAVRRYFAGYREVFDEWHTEPLGYEQMGDDAVLVHHVITGTSRGAGVPVEIEVWEIWEVGDDLLPTRVRQFTDRDAALEAHSGDE